MFVSFEIDLKERKISAQADDGAEYCWVGQVPLIVLSGAVATEDFDKYYEEVLEKYPHFIIRKKEAL